MSNEKTGGPAFPEGESYITTDLSGNTSTHRKGALKPGMTLLDHFAGLALPAIVAAYVEANGRCVGTDHIHYNCAAHAYKMAAAMITERNRIMNEKP